MKVEMSKNQIMFLLGISLLAGILCAISGRIEYVGNVEAVILSSCIIAGVKR